MRAQENDPRGTMTPNPISRRLLLLLAFLMPLATAAAAAPAAGKLEWQASYEEALEEAAETGRVVFVAFDHAGEARCDHFLKKLSKDRELTALAELTLNVPVSRETHKKKGSCPRFKGVDCSDHRRSEIALRESLALENEKGVVAAPQYIWLDGQGNVLYSVPFELDREGLLWCFAAALRSANPEQAPPFPENVRAPRRLLKGKVYRPADEDDLGRGMTDEELKSTLKQIKSTIFGMSNTGAVLRLLFTDEGDAVDYACVELSGVLRSFGRGRLPGTLHTIGAISPPAFWEALTDFGEEEDPEIRIEVAVALEQMATPLATRFATTALSREREERVRHVWIRALAACGGAEGKVRKKILAETEEESDERSCANATIALGYLTPHADVRERLGALLSSQSIDVRTAAACAMALTRDESYVELLDVAHQRCAEGTEKEALDRALQALREGLLVPLEADVARVTGSHTSRERIFFRARPSGQDEER
jgi:hypothetical protein